MPSLVRTIALAVALGATVPSVLGCADVGDDDVGEASNDATQSKGRFELFVGQDGQHYFQLLAGQGEKILRSEGYVSKSGAKGGVSSVIANGKSKARYEIWT